MGLVLVKDLREYRAAPTEEDASRVGLAIAVATALTATALAIWSADANHPG